MTSKQPLIYGICEEMDDAIDKITELKEIINDVEENGFKESYALLFMTRTKEAQLEFYKRELQIAIDNYDFLFNHTVDQD